MPSNPLSAQEKLFHRDRLRSARYSALADAEGFSEICFAIEALGMRLLGRQQTLGAYRQAIIALATSVPIRDELAQKFPGCFSQLNSLYSLLNTARNDVMHTGAYARHATSAAIELCIHLEEAVMGDDASRSQTVHDHMVRQTVTIKDWHPVAYARQLMLTHSFSFLPVSIDGDWKLVSEFSLACFLRKERTTRLAMSIREAVEQEDPMSLEVAIQIRPDALIDDLYRTAFPVGRRLWLVTQPDSSDELLGVLSPFELM